MLETENFVRFERVTSVVATSRGLLADIHNEQLRVDVLSSDVIRFKMSRGGCFDESPTVALCSDPLAGPVVDFIVERDEDRVKVVTSALVVSVWFDPFRLDVHRIDGSVVIETAADEHGRY